LLGTSGEYLLPVGGLGLPSLKLGEWLVCGPPPNFICSINFKRSGLEESLSEIPTSLSIYYLDLGKS